MQKTLGKYLRSVQEIFTQTRPKVDKRLTQM